MRFLRILVNRKSFTVESFTITKFSDWLHIRIALLAKAYILRLRETWSTTTNPSGLLSREVTAGHCTHISLLLVSAPKLKLIDLQLRVQEGSG